MTGHIWILSGYFWVFDDKCSRLSEVEFVCMQGCGFMILIVGAQMAGYQSHYLCAYTGGRGGVVENL